MDYQFRKGYLQLLFIMAATLLPLAFSMNSIGELSAQGFGTRTELEQGPAASGLKNASVNPAAAPNCRYGVASWSAADLPFLEQLGVGWTINFGVNFSNSPPSGAEYVPIVRLKQVFDSSTGQRLPQYVLRTPSLTDDPGGMGPLIQANPGRLWIVGNEIDRVIYQDDIEAEIYAEAYREIYEFIKSRDPSAQVGISGLVEVTPGRLQYLDMIWNAYLEKYHVSMPVDVWTMHIYILPEKRVDGLDSGAAVAIGTDPALAIIESFDPDGFGPLRHRDTCSRNNVYCYAEHDDISIFKEQAVAMRQWMKDHGQQNKPLILSEFSLLLPFEDEGDNDPNTCFVRDEYGNCFTPARVRRFMLRALDYLETAMDPSIGNPNDSNRLVQQWLWYAMNDGTTGTPNKLVESDRSRFTLAGETYRDRVSVDTRNVNLFPAQPAAIITDTSTPTETVNSRLSVEVHNNGNSSLSAPFTVTFFADQALTQEIGSEAIPAGLDGCARRSHRASVVWSELGTGIHRYWAKVDVANEVGEADEGDNVTTGLVLVNPERVFLPTLRKQS